ncbi:MAG: hypothetical protein JSV89_08500 [Spirochaetaceae bacterium]|nr:MAG: hypothetical protein JSV89_08500 [Spirochaetaceae bacterium]
MKQTIRAIGILVAVGLVVSCTTFQVSGVQMNKATPSYTEITQFEKKVVVHEFIGSSGGTNFLNLTATDMDNEILDAIRLEIELHSGDAAVNVTIKYEATFIDLLLNGITWGIYAPAHATISGTIVKFQ